MEATALPISGTFEINVRKHGDHRGSFAEVFRDDWFRDCVAPMHFVQENQSFSRHAGTIRGLHYQTGAAAQGKLVRCLSGSVFDVAVDIRHGSSSFGHWVSLVLTAEACNALWVPPGFLHGFCTLQPDTTVCYKVTSYYSQPHDAGIAWNDPDIAIDWPDIADPQCLSAKDRVQPRFRDLPVQFNYAMEDV